MSKVSIDIDSYAETLDEIPAQLKRMWEGGAAMRVKIELFPMWKQIDTGNPDMKMGKCLLPIEHLYSYRDTALQLMISYGVPWRITGPPSYTWFAASGSRLSMMTDRLRDLREEFFNEVKICERNYDELIAEAQIRLEEHFDRSDYPKTAAEFAARFKWKTEVTELHHITPSNDPRLDIPIKHIIRVMKELKDDLKSKADESSDKDSIYSMIV